MVEWEVANWSAVESGVVVVDAVLESECHGETERAKATHTHTQTHKQEIKGLAFALSFSLACL